MARRIAGAIVKARIAILILFALIAAYSVTSIGMVQVNYDFTRYLSDDTLTKRSLNLMQNEFGQNEQLSAMFVDFDEDVFNQAVSDIAKWDGVLYASFDPETGDKTVDGVHYQLLNVTLKDGADAFRMVEELRSAYSSSGEVVVAGSTASMLDMQEALKGEIQLVLVISVFVVLLVLLATSHAWAEPIPILITLALAILVNMGTNWVFGTISFVTYAVCAVLQLALSMDYAIMLLHMFDALRDEGMGDREAMVEALARSFMPIASSALTTVAGFFALLFMSFTIGFDIGIVLSKGILISMFTVFVVMPSLILCMPRLLRRTAHRPLNLGGAGIAKVVTRGGLAIAIILVLVIGCSAYFQSFNSYIFTYEGGQAQANRVDAVFGRTNAIAVLVPRGDSAADYESQIALIDALSAIEYARKPVVTSASAMVTTGAQAIRYYTPEDVADMLNLNGMIVNLFFRQHGFGDSVRGDALIETAYEAMPQNDEIAALKAQLDSAKAAFEGEHYARMIFALGMPASSKETYHVIDEMTAAVEAQYGDDYGVAGTSVSSHDISRAFEGDLLKVNLITAAALLLIIAISFRSFSVPVVLVCVIQGAIWVTMAISYAIRQPIFFMSYLMCVAMQMGATIDYGILLTNHYRVSRRELPPADALKRAIKLALPTILTSGLILVTAGFIVGRVCSVFYIASIGMLLARGAAISIFMILVLLPALLYLLDRFVVPRGRKVKELRSQVEL